MENHPVEVFLPDTVLENIFLRVSVRDLLSLINVNKQYRKVARLEKLWDGLQIGIGMERLQGGEMVIERRAIWGRGSPFPLDDVSPDDLAWLVSRVREAELQTWGHAGLPATKILTNIIQERKEEEEMNKAREELGAVGKEKIVTWSFSTWWMST